MRLSVAAEDRRRPAIPAKGGKNPVGSIFRCVCPVRRKTLRCYYFYSCLRTFCLGYRRLLFVNRKDHQPGAHGELPARRVDSKCAEQSRQRFE